MADRKSLSIYGSNGSPYNAPVRYELIQLPLEKHVRGVRQWLCMVERNGKASFERIYRSPDSQHPSRLKDVLELRKKQEVLYGATALSAMLGLTVARLRRRGLLGSLVYTSVFGGLVWGSLYLSDALKRDSLWSAYKERQLKDRALSTARDKAVSAKDATLTAATGAKDWVISVVGDKAVSAKDATWAAVKSKYQEIYTRISEASKKGSQK